MREFNERCESTIKPSNKIKMALDVLSPGEKKNKESGIIDETV